MKASILFVDDDPGITRMLTRLFHHSEYGVQTVNSAKVALELMDSVHFDVIVADQQMPKMGGFTFLQQAHIKQPEAIKLMFSGRMEARDYYQEIEPGLIHQFILKPCFDDEFMAYIDTAVSTRLQTPVIDHS